MCYGKCLPTATEGETDRPDANQFFGEIEIDEICMGEKKREGGRNLIGCSLFFLRRFTRKHLFW